MIQVKNLHIGYKNNQERKIVKHGLSFSISEGELICLLGPNGCGKSTLLKTLSGLLPSLDGEIFIHNLNTRDISTREQSKLISLVLTDQINYSDFTVFEMVALGRNPYTGFLGTLADRDREMIGKALTSVNLSDFADRSYFSLSDGEKQRVMIAKALVQDTPVIFLDEPTAHLDLPNRVEIMLLLHNLCKETGKTIIISTHELELALQIAHSVILMDAANGVYTGIPEEMILNGKLQLVFETASVQFNPFTGSFEMNHCPTKRVNILSQGEGYHTYWTKRALVRLGYEITNEATLTIIINERQRIWTTDKDGIAEVYESLEALLAALSD
ncbi:MAG: ABC transporter ATP-binding protein [Bacteroidales bacterium]